jgi:hypothetical protein
MSDRLCRLAKRERKKLLLSYCKKKKFYSFFFKYCFWLVKNTCALKNERVLKFSSLLLCTVTLEEQCCWLYCWYF